MDRRLILTALSVALLAVAAHAACLGGGFVYDDHRFVEQNPALDSPDVAAFFLDPSTASAGEGIQHDVYRPLRTLLFAVEWHLFGTRAWAWHLVGLLLHVLASVLVLRLLWPLVGRAWPAAAAGAALFAVHPAGVESVAWISSQGDLLAMVLALLALIVLEREGALRTVGGTALAALACFAKESALVLPALLLLRDLALPKEAAPGRRTRYARVALLAVVAVAFLGLRLARIEGLAQVPEFPGGSRIAAARGMLAGLAWYARDLLAPSGFPFDLQLPVPLSFAEPAVVVGLGLLLTLVAAGVWGLWTRRALLAFATLGALACLVPVSNVLVPLKALVAERFLYPVLICVAAGVAWGVSRLGRTGRGIALAAVGVAVLVLAFVSADRARAWASDLTLWERVLRERPDHMRAYEGLGFEYLRAGRIHDAEIAYRSYLEANPADGKSMRLVGDAFGQVADAQRVLGSPDETTTRGGRHLARRAQLGMYAGALSTWDRVGLLRGRGSPRMVRETWEKVIEAATDLGDLAKVKEANDALLVLDGVDPEDREDVAAHAPFLRRRMRLDLAFRAAAVPEPRDLPSEARQQRLAVRAALLRDVGLPPQIPDREVLTRLLPMYRALARDPDADVYAYLTIFALLDRLGNRPAAEKALEEARRRFPDHPALRREP